MKLVYLCKSTLSKRHLCNRKWTTRMLIWLSAVWTCAGVCLLIITDLIISHRLENRTYSPILMPVAMGSWGCFITPRRAKRFICVLRGKYFNKILQKVSHVTTFGCTRKTHLRFSQRHRKFRNVACQRNELLFSSNDNEHIFWLFLKRTQLFGFLTLAIAGSTSQHPPPHRIKACHGPECY